MTADPVTVTPATSLKYVADLLVKEKVGAVPGLLSTGALDPPDGGHWEHDR